MFSHYNPNEFYTGLLASDSAIQNRHRIAISKYVGSNWRCLGKELGGFSSSQMDQLEEKFKAELIPFDEMICQLILKWEDHSQVKPTVGRLAQALFQCQMTSALGSIVDMDKVWNLFPFIDTLRQGKMVYLYFYQFNLWFPRLVIVMTMQACS